MSLTDNYDVKTGKVWQGTNIAAQLIGWDQALAIVDKQIEAHGLDVAKTLTSEEAEASGIHPHSDPSILYSNRRIFKRNRDDLLDRLENKKLYTKTDMAEGLKVYTSYCETTGFEPMSKEKAAEIDDDDGVTSNHGDDDDSDDEVDEEVVNDEEKVVEDDEEVVEDDEEVVEDDEEVVDDSDKEYKNEDEDDDDNSGMTADQLRDLV